MSSKKKIGNRVLVYEASLGDCDDPDVYASGVIGEYLNTKEGQWVYENCGGDHELMWYTITLGDEYHMGFVVHLWCNMDNKQLTYWKLLKK